MNARRLHILEQGLIAGAIGYAVLATFHATLNAAAGRPLFATAGRLGQVLLAGRDNAGSVIAFNGVHLGASLLLGIVTAALVFAIERNPRAWYVFFFVALAGTLFGTLVAAIASVEIAGALSWPAAVGGSVLAMIAVLAYLWLAHPALRRASYDGED